MPSGNLPLLSKKNKGKVVIVNLQRTKHDKHAYIKINTYVDNVMVELCRLLDVKIPKFYKPTVKLLSIHTQKTDKKFKVVVKDEELLDSIPYSENVDHSKCELDIKCSNDNSSVEQTDTTDVPDSHTHISQEDTVESNMIKRERKSSVEDNLDSKILNHISSENDTKAVEVDIKLEDEKDSNSQHINISENNKVCDPNDALFKNTLAKDKDGISVAKICRLDD